MKFLQTVLLSSIFIPLKPVIVSAQKPDLEARLNSFHAAIDAEWQYRLKTHPEMATYVGDARYNDRLTDFSAEAIAREERRTSVSWRFLRRSTPAVFLQKTFSISS